MPRLVTPLAGGGALLLGVVAGAADEAPRPTPGVLPVGTLHPVRPVLGVVPPCVLVIGEACGSPLCLNGFHLLNELGQLELFIITTRAEFLRDKFANILMAVCLRNLQKTEMG